MLNKRDELFNVISVHEPEIIAITEPLPKNAGNIVFSELEIPGYDMYINKNPKRGALLFVKSSRNSLEYCPLNNEEFEESVWVHFQSATGERVLIGCIYKSPNSSEENKIALENLLVSKHFENFDHICIVGDFNFPKINWVDFTGIGMEDRRFIDVLHDAYFTQMVTKPTRRREGNLPSLLDLIIVNDEKLVSDIQHNSPIGKSDHDVLIFKLYVENERKQNEDIYKYDLCKGDFDSMRSYLLEQNWTRLADMDVESCWLEIKTHIHIYYSNG